MERDPGEAGQECLSIGFELVVFLFFLVCLLFLEAILHLLMLAYHYPHKNLRFYHLHHSTRHGCPFWKKRCFFFGWAPAGPLLPLLIGCVQAPVILGFCLAFPPCRITPHCLGVVSRGVDAHHLGH